jgi:hypothetical protein
MKGRERIERKPNPQSTFPEWLAEYSVRKFI